VVIKNSYIKDLSIGLLYPEQFNVEMIGGFIGSMVGDGDLTIQ